MYVARSDKKAPPPREQNLENNIIDMSTSINIPNTYIGEQPAMNTPINNTGAIPKVVPEKTVPNYSFPPPPINRKENLPPKTGTSGEYANLLKDMIRESNSEYCSNLERRLDDKIQESLMLGFSEM